MDFRDERDVLNKHLEGARTGWPSTIELARKMVTGGNEGPRENMTISLCQPTEEPVRAESPAAAHRFHSLDGFADYLCNYGGDDLLVMIDPEHGEMQGVLDERAEDGFEVISFRPIPHPLLTPWQVQVEGDLADPIRDFCRFIAANKSVIRQPKASDLVMVFKQIRLSKNITIHEGRGADSLNGILVETKLTGGQVGHVPMALPESVVIHCPLFADGCDPVDIQIDLALEVGDDDKVYVRMTSSDLKVKQLETIRQMRVMLVKQLKSDSIVSLGTVRREPWKYINR